MRRPQSIKQVILVLSGKGGVGKSTVTTELALSLAEKGFKIGVLDVDLTGPSIPQMFGFGEEKIVASETGWKPVYVDETGGRIGLISVGFLLKNKDDPVIWRGPKKAAMIKQFMQDVDWGELDYLLIDTPPGTSDEHISIMGHLNSNANMNVGAIIVTTPQAVSLSDVRREIDFCRKVGLNILGLIENMSGFVCPHCAECSALFSTGGGEALAKELAILFLGAIPIDPTLTSLMETTSFSLAFKQSQLVHVFSSIIDLLLVPVPLSAISQQ